ncbi:hypothetical protein ACSFA3_23570, partial [Variovorax sp. RHLX14]
FAHGFSIPTNIVWARDRNAPGRLNISALRSVDQFLSHIVRITDSGMADHLVSTFGVAKPW